MPNTYTLSTSGTTWSNLSAWTGSPATVPLNSSGGASTDVCIVTAATTTLDVGIAISTGSVQFNTGASVFTQNSGITIALSGAGSWNAAATPLGLNSTFNGTVTQSAGTFYGMTTNGGTLTFSSTATFTMTGGAFLAGVNGTNQTYTVNTNGLIASTAGTPTFAYINNAANGNTVTVNMNNTGALASNLTWNFGTYSFCGQSYLGRLNVTASSAVVATFGSTAANVYLCWPSTNTSPQLYTSITLGGTWNCAAAAWWFGSNAAFESYATNSLFSLTGTWNQTAGTLTLSNASSNGFQVTISISGTVALTGTSVLNGWAATTSLGNIVMASGGSITANANTQLIQFYNTANGSLTLTGGSITCTSGAGYYQRVTNLTYTATAISIQGVPFLIYNSNGSPPCLATGQGANTLALTGTTLQTYYLIARGSTGFVRFDQSPATQESYNSAHWTDYAFAMADVNNLGEYIVTLPGNLPADNYIFYAYKQSASGPFTSDAPAVTLLHITWNGTSIVITPATNFVAIG